MCLLHYFHRNNLMHFKVSPMYTEMNMYSEQEQNSLLSIMTATAYRNPDMQMCKGPGKIRTHCGGNIVLCDVAHPWQNAATFVARRAGATNVSGRISETFYMSRTQMLCAWQNKSTFGKHDHISIMLLPRCVLVLPRLTWHAKPFEYEADSKVEHSEQHAIESHQNNWPVNLSAHVQEVNKIYGLVSHASISLFSCFTRLFELTINITVWAKRQERQRSRTTKKLLK